MTEPKWIELARSYLGLKEIKGSQNEPKILDLWKAAKLGGIKNDEVPWCSAFVSGVLEKSGIKSTRADSARSYLNWGSKLGAPIYGCIVIFERGALSGHVGFVVGRDAKDNLMVLGGNQGDMVSIRAFDEKRVLGYRWPISEKIVADINLPLVTNNGEVSKNEA